MAYSLHGLSAEASQKLSLEKYRKQNFKFDTEMREALKCLVSPGTIEPKRSAPTPF